MIVGIMQPYFMPYIGYWQLMSAVDKYVVFDDVNYIKRGYSNRNSILMQGSGKMFSISVAGASQNKKYNELTICDDFKKFHSSIEACYKKAPYYNMTQALLQEITGFPNRELGHFMLHSFSVVLDYLGVHTELILSSSIEKDDSLKGAEKIRQICKILNADTYINTIGGKELYDFDFFKSVGIELNFLRTIPITYSQFGNEFVPNLSIIDVLMFNSSNEINELLKSYSLVNSDSIDTSL